MRLNVLQEQLTTSSGGQVAYEFEYEIEACRGEIVEGLSGRVLCLNASGQDVPTQSRHHFGKCILGTNGVAFSLNASAPLNQWGEVQFVYSEVAKSFRPSPN